MAENSPETTDKSQSDKFKKAAREHGADPSVRRWDERMKKLAKAKPDKGD
jgi:hypothetical protein